MKKILLTFLGLGLFACSEHSDKDYQDLKNQLQACKNTVADLQNTPAQRILTAKKYFAENKFQEAEKSLNDLILKFPGAAETSEGKKMLLDVQAKSAQYKAEAEKKKTLGFRALESKSTVNVDSSLKYSFSSIQSSNRWIFDSYGDEWHYRDAERGNDLIVAKVSISSEDKNPNLAPVGVYIMKNGVLTLDGLMEYEFAKWEDYATYLGNYGDRGNNFAYTKNIRFNLGYQVSEETLKNNSVFVVLYHKDCMMRTEDRFGNPPVEYVPSGCDLKKTLTVDDFGAGYTLLKVFNSSKL